MGFLPIILCLTTIGLSSAALQLHINRDYVVMDNDIVQVTLANPGGYVAGVAYNGIDNLLELENDDNNRGYWDVVGSSGLERVRAMKFKVIVQNLKQIEVSFTRDWNHFLQGRFVPVSIDIRYIMLLGSSGFYSYAIFNHIKEWPAFHIAQIRLVLKLRHDKFHYMALSDKKQRFMPLAEDRMHGKALAYPEAVLLVNPVEPQFKGEVDDKYQYSEEGKDIKVHGWMATRQSESESVGVWQITPSNEFRSGGPHKQELTSHVGPTCLTDFLSSHYTGDDVVSVQIPQNQPWKKVYGPVFIYINSGAGRSQLWSDAKAQMRVQAQNWPYEFPASEDFPKSNQRGNVMGRLLVLDRHTSNINIPALNAYVGLAAPGNAGSWQTEAKGYQFWQTTDKNGYFSIKGVRPGIYNIYAWVPGFIGDYKYSVVINITPGSTLNVHDLIYQPPRDGPTLWEIGIPDRSAAEFYIPDPNPSFVNKLYLNDRLEKFRQYGLWDRYSELYRRTDLVYNVGSSDYTKDWFFAQVVRNIGNNRIEGTTWQIKFKLLKAFHRRTYKLRIAIAGSMLSFLQVRVNSPAGEPVFSSNGLMGRENIIARHGIHGLYTLLNINVPGSQLVGGINTIFLSQPRSSSAFQGIMYDYLRLEGPAL